MDIKWLEDFVSLAETRSFSRAAALRHVTQPAFSRRIQALEAWAGVDLVDRSAYPTSLTPAGASFLAQATDILGALASTRSLMRSHMSSGQDMVEVAVPHTLAFTFYPRWLSALRQSFGEVKSRLMAHNVHDAVMVLSEGGCDLLMVYHHASQPLPLSPDRYDMISLGHELLAPYARPNERGQPLFALTTAGRAKVLPFLAYSTGAYLGRMVDLVLKRAPSPPLLDTVYETDMAEGLKAMALEGHGLAFLPSSSVQRDVEEGRLVRASEVGDYEIALEIRLYRERPEQTKRAKGVSDQLWDYLSSQLP